MEKPANRQGELPVAGPQMLEALLNEAVGAIITIDEQGIMLNANPAAERLFGYPLGELIGCNVKMLMPEPHRGKHDEYLEHHVRTGVKKIIGTGRNVEGRRKDGSLFPMHLAVSTFQVDGVRYFAGIVHDLSEQERLQRDLGRQKAFIEAVFNTLPDALVVTDHGRTITLANRAVKETFGYNVEDLVGQSVECLFETHQEFERVGGLETNLPPGERFEPTQASYRRSDGQVFPGQFVGAHLKEANGNPIGFLSLVWDISQDIEQRKALSAAQRMEAFGQLTGGIAHDFNNLLTVIMGNQELLEMRLSDERDIALLKRAQNASEMGARLTNRLLTFARRRQLEPIEIDLNEQVLTMADLLRRTLGSDLNLSTQLSPGLAPIMADPSEIENAILNLSINARDAMETNGRLIIETKEVDIDHGMAGPEARLSPGRYVRLSVSDSGHGMPESIISRAFEPFFTTKAAGKGTGLGLSTIYGFVRQSGGTATIYSEVGQGTTVNLYFPSITANADRGASADGATADVDSEPRGERILLVEDNDEVRELTEQRLTALGYDVLVAVNGSEAVAVLESGREVALVFSDVVMPGGMSGLDVYKWVSDNRPECKILLTSGFSADIINGDENAELDLEILRKPYTLRELATALRNKLNG